MAVQDWGEDGGLLLKEGWGRSYGFLQRNGPESCSFAPQNHLGAVPGSLLFTFFVRISDGDGQCGRGRLVNLMSLPFYPLRVIMGPRRKNTRREVLKGKKRKRREMRKRGRKEQTPSAPAEAMPRSS